VNNDLRWFPPIERMTPAQARRRAWLGALVALAFWGALVAVLAAVLAAWFLNLPAPTL
jgi:hypothetical protein